MTFLSLRISLLSCSKTVLEKFLKSVQRFSEVALDHSFSMSGLWARIVSFFRFISFVCIAWLYLSGASFSVLPDEILANPILESRARILSSNLRCLVCQNETIDESSAPLARDLRLLIREKLTTGESDEEILKFITARYGESILMQPPLTARLPFSGSPP